MQILGNLLPAWLRSAVLSFLAAAVVFAGHASALTADDIRDLEIRVEAGDVEAMHELGSAFRIGSGVPRDLARAEDLLRAAFEAGRENSATSLARVVALNGNYAEAIALFDRAVESGVPGAATWRADHHVNGRLGELSDPAFGERELVARIETGDDRSAYILADALDGGASLLQKDAARAAEIYEGLVAREYTDAYAKLASLLALGDGVPQDTDRAIDLLEVALAAGEKDVIWDLTDLLLASGDIDAVIATLETAAQSDNSAATFLLARLNARNQLGSRSDPAAGKAVLAELSAGGSSRATRILSRLLRDGQDGIDADLVYAQLDALSEAGDDRATSELLALLRNVPGVVDDPVSKRAEILEARGDSLNSLTYTDETVRLATETERGKQRYRTIASALSAADDRAYTAGMLRTLWSDRNSYIYVLQTELSALGYYRGTNTATMTRSTIRAIMRFCRDNGIYEDCKMGPLRTSAARAIIPAIASAR